MKALWYWYTDHAHRFPVWLGFAIIGFLSAAPFALYSLVVHGWWRALLLAPLAALIAITLLPLPIRFAIWVVRITRYAFYYAKVSQRSKWKVTRTHHRGWKPPAPWYKAIFTRIVWNLQGLLRFVGITGTPKVSKKVAKATQVKSNNPWWVEVSSDLLAASVIKKMKDN